MYYLSTIDDYRKEILLKLTGDGFIECELEDDKIDAIINSALRELQRYITSTNLITLPFKKCIDLSNTDDTEGIQLKVNTVVMIYRTSELSGSSSSMDPMQVAQWQLLSGMGNMMYFQDAVWNYSAWTTLQQIRNTTSTDLAFRYDKNTDKLYINTSTGTPDRITIEYIPIFESVEDIKSEYWKDMLLRLAVALTKVTLGRIRSRYTQSNALWQGDGETMLAEGKEELNALREMLLQNSELVYPID